jgi:hypothetical protein
MRLSFENALELLKAGKKMRRESWGKAAYIQKELSHHIQLNIHDCCAEDWIEFNSLLTLADLKPGQKFNFAYRGYVPGSYNIVINDCYLLIQKSSNVTLIPYTNSVEYELRNEKGNIEVILVD